MDTKLKNFSRQWYLKIAAYLVFVICGIGIMQVLWEFWPDTDFSVAVNPVYEESDQFGYEIREYAYDVINTEGSYESREAIENGEYVTEDEMESEMRSYYDRWIDMDGAVRFQIDKGENYTNIIVIEEYPENTETWVEESDYPFDQGEAYLYEGTEEGGQSNWQNGNHQGKKSTYEKFVEENQELKEGIRDSQIKGQLRYYDETIQRMKASSDLFIHEFIDKDSQMIQQKINKYELLPIYGYISGDNVESNNIWLRDVLEQYNINASWNLFVGVKKDTFNEKSAQWNSSYIKTTEGLQKMMGLAAAMVLAVIYLLLVTGRRPKEEEIYFNFMDRVWSEIQLGIGMFVILIEMAVFEITFSYPRVRNVVEWQQNLSTAVTIFVGTVLLMILLSQIKRMKGRKFLEGFIILRFIMKCLRGVKAVLQNIWRRGKLFHRLLFLAIVMPLLCATWIGVPFVIAFVIIIIHKYMGDFDQICKGAELVRGGQLDHEIIVNSSEPVLTGLAENINMISQGLDHAIAGELRSERLKAELISNVSHDLKTPLTSIVTYVDLLKKEEINNDTAKDYIDVIDRKSQRLTVLTNDLFEAAKASSGDMPVNLEKVDLNAIVRQALGEFDERLRTAELDVRTKLPEEPSYIKADGRLTWRVMDNLLSNVVKYALTGSRVYIDVERDLEQVILTVKNISAHELNIPSDELMERFKRGDEARNSEGSGLGLNIANSLIDLQHGSFQIDIDGDLFKVTVGMKQFLE